MTAETYAVGPNRGPTIRSIASEILDVPTIREHKLSALAVTRQSVVLVRLLTSDGVEGVGEASTLGGPLWAEESVETIKAVVDGYLAPALIGRPLSAARAARGAIDAAARRNNAAKGAVETALWDALGKTLEAPVHAFLGGAVRHEVPALWALASGDPEQEVDEALGMIERGRHTDFKIKIGATSPEADVARLQAVAQGIEGRGRLAVVDANQGWDEPTADRWIPALDEIGVRLLEQPLPAANLNGSARLATRHALPLLADESVFTPEDAVAVGAARAADAVSLKIVKHGGLLGVMDVAAAARASGLGLYGGCLLETSVGTAAQLHAYAAVPRLDWGTELFGPLIMTEDLVTEPLVYADGALRLPEGPGLGMTLDEDKVARFRRPGTEARHA